MAETIHVGDINSTAYLSVLNEGVPLDVNLGLFITRIVRIKRPSGGPLLVLPGPVAIEIDPDDGVTKIKLVTGAANDFEVDEPGVYAAEVELGDSVGGKWTSDSVTLFTAQPNLT